MASEIALRNEAPGSQSEIWRKSGLILPYGYIVIIHKKLQEMKHELENSEDVSILSFGVSTHHRCGKGGPKLPAVAVVFSL